MCSRIRASDTAESAKGVDCLIDVRNLRTSLNRELSRPVTTGYAERHLVRPMLAGADTQFSQRLLSRAIQICPRSSLDVHRHEIGHFYALSRLTFVTASVVNVTAQQLFNCSRKSYRGDRWVMPIIVLEVDDHSPSNKWNAPWLAESLGVDLR